MYDDTTFKLSSLSVVYSVLRISCGLYGLLLSVISHIKKSLFYFLTQGYNLSTLLLEGSESNS